MRTRTLDQRYDFKGFGGCDAFCWFRSYEEAGEPPVVILTEMPDNPGTSVTNVIEELATVASGVAEHRPFILIEHYLNGVRGEETWDLCQFTWHGRKASKPRWRRMAAEEVERLTGESVTEWTPPTNHQRQE